MIQPSIEHRAGRMLAGLLESENDHGKLVLTVSLTGEGGKRFHQAFEIRKWVGRDGPMLSVGVHGSGDWEQGIRTIQVFHVNPQNGRVIPARDDRAKNPVLAYAAKVAWGYALNGQTPAPKNGTVEVEEQAICGMCGRELTHPDSIERGIGPECAGKSLTGQTILGGLT